MPVRRTNSGLVALTGGTREPLDAVRCVGNRSSGEMGFAVAAEAARRGGEVVLVTDRENRAPCERPIT